MLKLVIYNAEGKILRNLTVFDPADAKIQASEGEFWSEGHADSNTEYFLSGVLTLRPTLPVPETHTIATGTDWTLTGIPDGTEVYTDGVFVATTDGSDLVLTFPEAGVWQVRLEPSFPARAAHIEVTVT